MVRGAVDGDVLRLVELEQKTETAAHWSRDQYAEVFARGSSRLCWVVETAGQVRGFLIARLLGNECELENIVVEPEVQRRQFGSALVSRLLEQARDRGAQAIFLEVRESNLAARRLYTKWGFVESGRRRSYYSDPVEDAILYRFNILG